MKENIGHKIKELRKNKNIKASELAKLIGKSRATIYRYENGEIESIPYTVLKPIADALGVSISYLIETEEDNSYSKNKNNTEEKNNTTQISKLDLNEFNESTVNFVNKILALELKEETLKEVLQYSIYLKNNR